MLLQGPLKPEIQNRKLFDYQIVEFKGLKVKDTKISVQFITI